MDDDSDFVTEVEDDDYDNATEASDDSDDDVDPTQVMLPSSFNKLHFSIFGCLYCFLC